MVFWKNYDFWNIFGKKRKRSKRKKQKEKVKEKKEPK
jgi:hypothetical protein